MHKRDVAILLVSAFAVYFSIQNEGSFYFTKAWFHVSGANADGPPLPPTLMADLNGDGAMELIVATQASRIQIITPKPPGHTGEGFAAADVIADVSLVPAGWPDYMRTAKRAVAMKNGFLDAKPTETVRALRKQILVIVLADWSVVCLDHNLHRLWQTRVKEEIKGPDGRPAAYGWASANTHAREIGILITNHTAKTGDKGLVVIGGSLDLGDLEGEDTLEAELHAESESRDAQRASHKTASERNTVNVMGVDVSKHFSYYALDGGTGQERWRHEGRDFHRDVADLAEQIIPQHNFRLTAKSLEGTHYGEVACQDYRESVLGVLPHKWDSRDDTSLKLAHFVRHREAQQEGKSGPKTPSTRNKGALQRRPPSKHGVDHSNPVVKLFGQAAETATKGKASPAASPANFQPYNPPNVLVAHLEEGIEAVDLLTGQTLCKLYLPPGGMHTDLNADGMLDHIQVTGRLHQGETHMQGGHKHGHACWVNALSGIPPHLHYFNGSLCLSHNGISDLFGGLRNGEPAGPLQVLSPTVVPAPTRFGAYRRGSGTAVFLNSLGEMTAYDHHGELLWQHAFNNLAWETWEASSEVRNERRSSPTLKAIPLQWGGIPTVVLASGDTHGAIISQQGHLLDQFKLPSASIVPLIPGDFNGDGLTDVVMVTHDGMFGYQQIRRVGGVPFNALLAILIVAMIWVYTTYQVVPKVQNKGRSTDRTD